MARKRNAGWFRRGKDPRRHLLTSEEKRRGGVTRGRQLLQEMHDVVYRHNAAEQHQAGEEHSFPPGSLFNNDPLPH